MMYWCFDVLLNSPNTHFFVHITFFHFSPDITFGLENDGGFNGLCQESPSLPSLSSCISAQVRGTKNVWMAALGFFFEINDFLFGVFLSLYRRFCLFVCVVCFSPLPKNEGVLLLLRRLTKNISYLFLLSLWLNCSTILRVIDHQQLTELW